MEDQPFLDKYKVFRRIALMWAMYIITDTVYSVFADVSLINSAVVSALAIVIGLMATVVGFYTQARTKEDSQIRNIALDTLAYQDLIDDEKENYVSPEDPH